MSDESDNESIYEKPSKELLEFITIINKKENNIIKEFENLKNSDKKKIITELKCISSNNSSILFKLIFSNIPTEIKTEIINRYNNSDPNDKKFDNWLNNILRIPFDNYNKPINLSTQFKINQFLENANKILDNAVYGHEKGKHKIIQYLAQLISNPSSKGFNLGIYGPCGNGKTTLIEHGLSKILNRPFVCISLGGATDASYLNGHGYTYEGSTWGQIIDVIMKAKVMDPIIYFDELDKISNTPKGDEIINLLIHLTDPVQNIHFQDKYFGNINIDLSKVMFIFSFNNIKKINHILLDRIFTIKTNGFSTKEKIQISKNYLIPNIIRDINNKYLDNLDDNVIEQLITTYTCEGGVRTLKKLLYEIYREINLQSITGNIKKRKRYDWDYINSFIKTFKPIKNDKIHQIPAIGKINGLYCMSEFGIGGILPIEANWIPSESIIGLQVTGNLGSVMNESVTVAKTVAWNLLPNERKEYWFNRWHKYKSGIHLHCQELSCSKEGPSAACAITLCIYSLLMGLQIDNTFAITGEINLSGDVLSIGGLKEKIYGAIVAGCTSVYIPKQNKNDLEIILKKDENIKIKIIPINHISEIIKLLWN